MNIHWKDWCWGSNTLATWCKELTHLKRPWYWERFREGGEGDGRGWDGWMASLTQWTWVWVNSGSWWWIGKPGMLQSMGSQRVGLNWMTELNSCLLWRNVRSFADFLIWSSVHLLFSSVQFSHSVMLDSLRLTAHQASLSVTNSQSLLKLMSIN